MSQFHARRYRLFACRRSSHMDRVVHNWAWFQIYIRVDPESICHKRGGKILVDRKRKQASLRRKSEIYFLPLPDAGLAGIMDTKDMITIVLADNQPAVRAGLRMRLALEADMQIVGAARDGNEAFHVANRLNPDIVIMDLEMPVMDGLAATKALKSSIPESQVIILTIHDDETSRQNAREAGAAGFVSKHADEVALLNTIRALASRSKRTG